MIKTLERYIAKTVILASGIAALIITGIVFVMSLLGEAKNVGTGDYGLGQTVLFVLAHLPSDLYHFSPLIILLGSIIALSLLSSYRELAVMRASGFSTNKIIYSVLAAALFLILLMSLIGEWIGPGLSYKAVIHRENAKHGDQVVATASGVWLHIDNNFIHVNTVIDRQLLQGVTRYQFDDNRSLRKVYHAKTLSVIDGEWLMKEGVKTTFYPERTKSESFVQAPWDLKFNSNLLTIGLLEPSELSLPKLAKFSRFLEQNGLQASEYRYNFWQRLFQPLASLVMIFLALPFVLGAYSNATMGWRIIVGISLGIAFFILDALLGQLCIVYQLPAVLAALIPSLIFALFGWFMSRRMIRY
jgi:lipopolysaccharide export system permease protein